ncbi:MAG TPA: tetratricopeptide repeat protein, partial [Planctomycetota bacterium]|nr:tetratricopeptide repeat protein [Planctomycetota bacterium]
ESIPLEIGTSDSALAGHGLSKTVPYTVSSSGTLHVWATSEAFDSFLRVESAEGALLGEDDNAAGGKTPFLALEVVKGAALRITVASASEGGAGRVTLVLRESPETEQTRAVAMAALESLDEADSLREKGDLDGARRKVRGTLESLKGVPGVGESAAAANALWQIGQRAYALRDLRMTSEACGRVRDFREGFLPPDHPDLQAARLNLAVTIEALGDLPGARALEEKVLEVRTRTLPEDHPDLQAARQGLAATICTLGDLQGARALQEEVLKVRSRTLPEDHPNVQAARLDLARTIFSLGDLAGARALFEKVLEVRSRTLPEDHPDLQRTRANLAVTLKALGDLPRARALEEKVL